VCACVCVCILRALPVNVAQVEDALARVQHMGGTPVLDLTKQPTYQLGVLALRVCGGVTGPQWQLRPGAPGSIPEVDPGYPEHLVRLVHTMVSLLAPATVVGGGLLHVCCIVVHAPPT
jgi:hypothetical protein